MSNLYPPIEPFDSGMLDVGDGHEIYWERCGQRGGRPALFLHGGPGSGCSANQRRLFNPSLYDAILFDQRGSGRSRPLADEPTADLSTNTTSHLIADMELLREVLGVERWTLTGLSWGSTLALAYAQRHPRRVEAIALGLVTTTSRAEVEWITRGVGRIFPREWERFSDAVPVGLRHRRIVDAYAELLADPDPQVRASAANEWCAWENAHVSLAPGHRDDPRFEDPAFALRFARLVTHYWRHHAFLGEDELVRHAPSLNGIPGVLIHGRFDVSSPLDTAWRLSKAWTTSRLIVVDDAGHGGGHFQDEFQRALDALAEVNGPRSRR